MRKALKQMKTGKTTSPYDIPIEAWKCLEKVGGIWLSRLFNEILMIKKMPDERKRSVVVPIYKNIGDIQNSTNYHGNKLTSHTTNLWERVMEQRFRQKTKLK